MMLNIPKMSRVKRGFLRKVPVPRLDSYGQRWRPVQHGELVDTIEKEFDLVGIKARSEIWSLSNDGSTLIGGMDLKMPKTVRKAMGIRRLDGIDYSLGVRHSNDQKYALTFAVGAHVIVCSNGLISGEFVIHRRHTKRLSLVDEVRVGVGEYLKRAPEIPSVINNLREVDVTRKRYEHMLIEAGRRDLLPWSHIGMVIREFENPSFEEFQIRNGWSLYNAFTYIAQKSVPMRQMKAIGGFREVILEAA